MADEIVGNIYEVLTIVSILDYTTVLQKGETLFWNEHPKGVLIEPDITVGKDKDSPRLLLLVSHTNAERASEKKFWRNVGEFVDARIALGSAVSLANIVFDSGQKRKLAAASDALFDGFIEADRKPYGDDLLRIASDLAEKVEKGRISVEKRIEFVQTYLKANPSDAKVLKLFAKDLETILNTSSKHGAGWFGAFTEVQKSRTVPRIPKVSPTYVRRGLGRLLPIDNEKELREIIKAAKARKPTKLPSYFYALDLSNKSLRGEIVKDQEMLGLVDLISEDQIVTLWKEILVTSDSLRQACNSVALSSDFPKMHEFVCDNFPDLKTAEGLKRALNDCFNNPDLVLSQKIALSNPARYGVWLFDYLTTLIKAHSGKQQGYGYTTLDKESNTKLGTGIGPHLSLFISREKSLRIDLIKAFAKSISTRLLDIGLAWIKKSKLEIESFYLKGLFEDKIYKSSKLDPLKTLIIEKLLSLNPNTNNRTPTYLTHFTGVGVATVETITVKNTVIVWQSASDKGVGHKMKELCGRIGMLRVTTDTSGTPVENTKIKKAILLIDGTWTDSHIKRLIECGFDAVFYANELDDLVKEIV
jgi:hypothetical protein